MSDQPTSRTAAERDTARADALAELTAELDDPETLDRVAFRRALLLWALTLPGWALALAALLAVALLVGGPIALVLLLTR